MNDRQSNGDAPGFQPENRTPLPPAGLYIHVPFCIKKCPYCNFYSVEDVSRITAFVEALHKEIRLSSPQPHTFDTLYIGGGTPSLLTGQQIRGLIECAQETFDFAEAVETTIEVNPGTVSAECIDGILKAGVNRVNVGVQSFDDDNLGVLERIHSAREACKTLETLRHRGVTNLGMDLIYGLPGQSAQDWHLDLARALDFGPEHLSCYMLSYEPNTPFSRRCRKGRLTPLDPDTVGHLFEETIYLLTDRGYHHYEVSNFSRGKRYRSKHNQKYWFHRPYVGFGPSAHSFIEPRRWWNHSTLDTYLASLEMNRLPTGGWEDLDVGQLMLETIFLGLRTSAGIDTSVFENRYNLNFETYFGELLDQLRSQGLLDRRQGRTALTRKGLLVCDTVAALFADKLDGVVKSPISALR